MLLHEPTSLILSIGLDRPAEEMALTETSPGRVRVIPRGVVAIEGALTALNTRFTRRLGNVVATCNKKLFIVYPLQGFFNLHSNLQPTVATT